MYQGKEYQEDLDLNLYDFHARQYDPSIGRTTTLDPMSHMFYSISPYGWAGNNPMRYLDPTGMVIEDGSRKEWDKQRGYVESRRDRLQSKADKLSAKAEAKGWSSEKLSRKMGNVNERVASLNSSLGTMTELENSAQVYSLKSVTGVGGVTYDTKTGNVVIAFGGTANFVHETTHAGQFESGHMAFDGKTGQTFGQDIMDEVAGYKAQFAYDPSSVTGYTASSVAKSFSDITPAWVQSLVGETGKLYAPGGSANTGQVPVDINSGKAQLLRAYPNAAGYLGTKPANFRLRDEPGIIMAPFEYNGY